jgi:hypothetical protein
MREILPAGCQIRFPSKTLPDQFARMAVHYSDWVARHDVTRSSGERRWAEQYYNELYSVSSKRFAPAFEVMLSEVELETVHGCMRTRDGTCIPESCLVDTRVASKGFASPVQPVPPVISLVGSWSLNYAHWLMDCLPRLAAIQFETQGQSVLLPYGAGTFHHESLRALGINNCLEMPTPTVSAEDLRLVHAASRTGYPRREFLTALRNRFRESASPLHPAKRIYVSRDGSSRRVLNEKDVFEVFRAYGFEKVRCEDLSFREQLALFTSAEIIAGPHGAGIYNLVFAAPGTRVLEFYNPLRWDAASARISSLLGLDHWHLFGEDCGKTFDMTVPPETADRLLKTLEMSQ